MNNLEIKEQVYLLAQEHCGLKVGDLVRIIRGAGDYEGGWPCVWNIYQTDHIGDIGEIVYIGRWGCSIIFEDDNSGLLFPYFVLEKVKRPAHEFKPFDRVLVRDKDDDEWKPQLFSCYCDDHIYKYYTLAEDSFVQCIPYEGNEHLVGTTDKPK